MHYDIFLDHDLARTVLQSCSGGQPLPAAFAASRPVRSYAFPACYVVRDQSEFGLRLSAFLTRS
jgi:hypothetical protein